MSAHSLLHAATLERLEPGRLLVLGFSGGPDSAATLHALHAAGWPLLAAHLDHGLRPESAGEAQAAAAVAAACGVGFASQRVDVAALAAANGQTIEEAAREARYVFLFGLAHEHGAQAVVVAHNADDQAETILMHLLRGAGPQGLQGMPDVWLPNPWSERVALVRPLLGSSRSDVLAYCEAHELAVLHDQSNEDQMFFRNKVRHELLPRMEQFAPGVKGRLVQTGELLAAEEVVLRATAEDAWRRSLAAAGPGYVGLQRSALQAEPLALQRRVLQRAARLLRLQGAELSFALVEQARDALHGEAGPYDWFDGLVILAEGERLWLAERSAQLPALWPQTPQDDQHLETPAAVPLGKGWILRLDESEARVGVAADVYETWLDAERTGGELTLRRPRPGDRMALAQGSQKLSDVFINAKLPQRARAAWPLLCKGDEVVWAPGLRLAHGYAAKAGQPALHARVIKNDQ
ncbi:MAG: tRNA lysidine(34) synthetase TilS [Anaerolineales bacterium]|nr:MAG: tRNA lysidine(34) synthetase TilS [Anaerolineales bacterium]